MLYLLAYRLFISAPPSSQSPSLCLSSSSPALSPCSFFHSCFLPYSLSSLSLSSGPHLPSLLSSCLMLWYIWQPWGDSHIPSHLHSERHMFPCFLHVWTFIYTVGVVLLFHHCPTSHSWLHLQITVGKSSGSNTAPYCWAAVTEPWNLSQLLFNTCCDEVMPSGCL